MAVPTTELRAIALKQQLILPGSAIPFIVGRKRSVLALEAALESDGIFGALLQTERHIEDPAIQDLAPVGVRCEIAGHIKLPNGSYKVLAEGIQRFVISETMSLDPLILVKTRGFEEVDVFPQTTTVAAHKLMTEVVEIASQLASHDYIVDAELPSWNAEGEPSVSVGLRMAFRSVGYNQRYLYGYLHQVLDEPRVTSLADRIAPLLQSTKEDLIYCLTEPNSLKRLKRVCAMLKLEIEKLNWDYKIRERVFMAIEEQHREIYLREQLKVIIQELGDYGSLALHNPVFRGRGFKVNSRLLFVLMPFHERFLPVFTEIIRPVAQRLGFECMRADDIYGPKPIVEDIWRLVNEAQVILADVTGRNPNVFYEVGLAHAVGKEVIIVTQDIEDVPFDLKHLRCIIYNDSVAGFRRFEREVEETLKSFVSVREPARD